MYSACFVFGGIDFSLQHSCHGVMYHQLSVWLFHGLLQDKYSEFFIHKTLSSSQHMQPPVPGEGENDLGIGGVTGRQMQQMIVSLKV